MQDTLNKQPRPRFMGDDAPAPATGSAFAPLVDKVGVPLLWLAAGYLLCKMTQKRGAA